MELIKIDDLCKVYGRGENQVAALDHVSLTIEKGEFTAITGPSGSGKSTLLHIIGGVDMPTSGKVFLDGQDIYAGGHDKLAIFRRRQVGLIYQFHNLIPTLNVVENITLPILMDRRKVNEERLNDLLQMLGLKERRTHLPNQLSGGQQQRVAIARTLAPEPAVLFMDEPLSNLDAKLRVEMRNAIKRIQQQVGITTLYVTHDQEEALAVSDRIAVMNGGVIQQIDTPKNIYQRPANLFVSTFIGLSNIMDGTVDMSQGGTRVRIGDYSVAMDNLDDAVFQGQPVKVSVRPEEFIISRSSQEGIPAIVRSSVFLGVTTHYFVEAEDGREMEVIQNSDIWDIIPDHTPVRLGVQPAKINVFNQEGTMSLIVRREHA